MALKNLNEYLSLVPVVENSPHRYLRSSYDKEGDVLYIHFREPGPATDSELTDDDVIVRFEGEEIIGITILHASKRAESN